MCACIYYTYMAYTCKMLEMHTFGWEGNLMPWSLHGHMTCVLTQDQGTWSSMLFGDHLETSSFNIKLWFFKWNPVSRWRVCPGLGALANTQSHLLLPPQLARRASQLPAPLLSVTQGTPKLPFTSPSAIAAVGA